MTCLHTFCSPSVCQAESELLKKCPSGTQCSGAKWQWPDLGRHSVLLHSGAESSCQRFMQWLVPSTCCITSSLPFAAAPCNALRRAPVLQQSRTQRVPRLQTMFLFSKGTKPVTTTVNGTAAEAPPLQNGHAEAHIPVAAQQLMQVIKGRRSVYPKDLSDPADNPVTRCTSSALTGSYVHDHLQSAQRAPVQGASGAAPGGCRMGAKPWHQLSVGVDCARKRKPDNCA